MKVTICRDMPDGTPVDYTFTTHVAPDQAELVFDECVTEQWNSHEFHAGLPPMFLYGLVIEAAPRLAKRGLVLETYFFVNPQG